MDLCELKRWARSELFAKDRDITLQTDRVFAGIGSAPIGIIVLWYGSIASIPSNWQLCDGTNGTPDLRDNFVVGAGSSYSVDDTGGAQTHRHSFSGTTGNGGNSRNAGTDTAGSVDSRFDHTHSYSGNTNYISNLPPYYALAYIQRIS